MEVELEPEGGILSELMLRDDGAKKFVADCLLLLSPEEIKNCRLVCKQWDAFIKSNDFWKSKNVRKELSQKLLQRWKTAEPTTKRLAEVGQEIESIYCNETNVFCGMGNKVNVYDLASGKLSRELVVPGDVQCLAVVGGKGIVAALMGLRVYRPRTIVTIWSSTGSMDQLHFFNSENFHCPNDSCGFINSYGVRRIEVFGTNKVAMLSRHLSTKASLVVLEKGGRTWRRVDTKVLGCWDSPSSVLQLAIDGDWLAVLETETWETYKVKLWRGNEKCQDIALPEGFDFGFALVDSNLHELPHLILGKKTRPGNEIMVYKMEDTVASLVKSIKLERPVGNFRFNPIANQLCLGFLYGGVQGGIMVHQFMKKELIAAELSPVKRVIRVSEASMSSMSMNSTCYVTAARRQNFHPGGPLIYDLWKTDLWMSNNIL